MPILTHKLVEKTPCPETGQTFLRDDSLAGFGVRLTQGSKTFILERRILGRNRRMTIGPFGPLTVEMARKRADELIGDVARGRDPAQEKIDIRRASTFGDLCDLYLERHAIRKKTGYEDKQIIETRLSLWKNRKINAVTRADVAGLHAAIGKTAPFRANRVVSLLRKMFNLARAWGLHTGENPGTGIERFKELPRERFVQPSEMPALLYAIEMEQNPFVRAAFMLMLVTGARRGEVLATKWKDLDLGAGLWYLPHTKANRSHTLPLPPAIARVIADLPRMAQNVHVFPGVRGNPLADLKRAWDRVRKNANLPDVRMHDLRRTAGSWLAGSGATLPLIGKVLNHSQAQTTMIYARLNIEPVRVALNGHADRVLAIEPKKPEIEHKAEGAGG